MDYKIATNEQMTSEHSQQLIVHIFANLFTQLNQWMEVKIPRSALVLKMGIKFWFSLKNLMRNTACGFACPRNINVDHIHWLFHPIFQIDGIVRIPLSRIQNKLLAGDVPQWKQMHLGSGSHWVVHIILVQQKLIQTPIWEINTDFL